MMENPAHNLHLLLDSAYEQSRRNTFANFKDIWSKVFDIDKDDTSSLLASISSLLDLFLKTKEIITNNPNLNSERNLKFLSKIEKALNNLNFEGDMKHFTSSIDRETLTALSYIAELMDTVLGLQNPQINEDEIKNLLIEIENLKESIIDSSLPEDIRQLLVKNLNLIKESLDNYKITGIEGMRVALEQSIGSIFMNNKSLSPLIEDVNVKSTFNIIDRLNTLLSTGVAVKELIAPAFSLLLK